MHENTTGLPSPLHTDSQARQGICMVGGQPAFAIEPARSLGTTPIAYRSDEIREIAINLETLCIEYACYSRINGTGNETRAAWAAFKAQIEALKAIA